MRLAKLLDGVAVAKMYTALYGRMVVTQDLEVHAIQYDSRKVERGDLFVAIRGESLDGHRFIDQAVSRGAGVVVVEDDDMVPDSFFQHAGVMKILVHDSRATLAGLAKNFYEDPSRRLRLLGVTGTNGKTTTTHLIKSILESGGEKVGLLGTIEYKIGDETVAATHTTPESLELNGLLATMVEKGCTSAVMEVSSHALAMRRVQGLEFRAGTFTNLTQDHLDFHGSMEDYFRAKKMLFTMLAGTARAVVNIDDAYGPRMAEGIEAASVTYGAGAQADVSVHEIEMTVHGTRCRIAHQGGTSTVTSSLVGRFNVSNILAAYATGVALRIPDAQICDGIARLRAVRGRFEQIASPRGWTAIVDYAHTPDALENCLSTIRDLLPRALGARVITVFGCGGNRDRGKRPIMGRIATGMSDITIVTSDNPRKEDPARIIEETVAGAVPGREVHTEIDRRAAIRRALMLARPGDIVLIAGKGHEDYQVLGETKVHFDDHEEIAAFIRTTP